MDIKVIKKLIKEQMVDMIDSETYVNVPDDEQDIDEVVTIRSPYQSKKSAIEYGNKMSRERSQKIEKLFQTKMMSDPVFKAKYVSEKDPMKKQAMKSDLLNASSDKTKIQLPELNPYVKDYLKSLIREQVGGMVPPGSNVEEELQEVGVEKKITDLSDKDFLIKFWNSDINEIHEAVHFVTEEIKFYGSLLRTVKTGPYKALYSKLISIDKGKLKWLVEIAKSKVKNPNFVPDMYR